MATKQKLEPAAADRLDRKLGLTETLSIVINRIIGSGIFRTPAPIMLIAGSAGIFFQVWILGGIATILGALCYAELVAMIPKSGGPYVFLKAAYPPIVTFLRGWAMFFVSETGAIAAVALFFSENAVSLFPAFSSSQVIGFVAIVLVGFLTLINSFGIQLSGKLQNLFSFLKLSVLFVIIGVSFSKGINTENFTSGSSLSGWAGVVAVFTAMRYGFFAYSGWEGATYVAEEVKNPSKNLPISLFAGIGLVLVVYLLINAAYLNILGVEAMGLSKAVAVDAMKYTLGTSGAILVLTAILISTFGNVNTQILVKSRTWFAMSRDKLFFKPLSKVSSKYKTPNNSMLAQAIWASVLIIVATQAKDAYETVIDFFSFTSAVFNILTFASIYVLRKKYPDLKRPYKVWGYPYTLILVLIIQMAFLVTTLVTAFIPSLLGILMTLSGCLYYKYVIPEDAKIQSIVEDPLV